MNKTNANGIPGFASTAEGIGTPVTVSIDRAKLQKMWEFVEDHRAVTVRYDKCHLHMANEAIENLQAALDEIWLFLSNALNGEE